MVPLVGLLSVSLAFSGHTHLSFPVDLIHVVSGDNYYESMLS